MPGRLFTEHAALEDVLTELFIIGGICFTCPCVTPWSASGSMVRPRIINSLRITSCSVSALTFRPRAAEGLRRSGARRRREQPEPTQDRGAATAGLGGSGPVASTLSRRPGAVGPAPRRRRRYADASAAALLNRSCGRRMAGGLGAEFTALSGRPGPAICYAGFRGASGADANYPVAGLCPCGLAT